MAVGVTAEWKCAIVAGSFAGGILWAAAATWTASSQFAILPNRRAPADLMPLRECRSWHRPRPTPKS